MKYFRIRLLSLLFTGLLSVTAYAEPETFSGTVEETAADNVLEYNFPEENIDNFEDYINVFEDKSIPQESATPIDTSENILASVNLDQKIIDEGLTDEIKIIKLDFDSMEGAEIPAGLEDVGIDTDQIVLSKTNDFQATFYVSQGQKLVHAYLPDDYKGKYYVTIDGADEFKQNFGEKEVIYSVINTADKTYDIKINVFKNKDYVGYLEGDEEIPEINNLDNILSGKYGESRAAELESIEETHNNGMVDEEKKEDSSIYQIIFIGILLIIIITGFVSYRIYKKNNDDE